MMNQECLKTTSVTLRRDSLNKVELLLTFDINVPKVDCIAMEF